MPDKRVTLSDVAEAAGVSRAAASLVVRNSPKLRPATRQRVLDAMDALGYVYHAGAASLRTRRTSVVGLMVSDISNFVFSTMTVGFEEGLREVGLQTMLTNTFDDSRQANQLMRSMVEQPVDAVVFVPVEGESGQGFDIAMLDRVPRLAIARRPLGDVPYLGADDVLGGRLAAEHLISTHDRRRIVYLGGPAAASVRHDRLEGVQAALAKSGAELVADLPGGMDLDGGRSLAEQLLASGTAFDAVICHNDMVAFAVIREFRDHGVDLTAVSVIGFDGLPVSRVFEPALTTVSIGPAHLGRLAAARIARIIAGDDDGAVQLVTPHLEVRASCGCRPTPPDFV